MFPSEQNINLAWDSWTQNKRQKKEGRHGGAGLHATCETSAVQKLLNWKITSCFLSRLLRAENSNICRTTLGSSRRRRHRAAACWGSSAESHHPKGSKPAKQQGKHKPVNFLRRLWAVWTYLISPERSLALHNGEKKNIERRKEGGGRKRMKLVGTAGHRENVK